MTEIPEHLRKRAEAARAKAEAEKGEPAAADAPAGAETPADPAESRIPAHLLERSRAAKAKAEGGEAAEAGGGGVAVAERPSAVTAVGPAAAGGVPVGAGPGGHTQRLLTVVKSGSIQDVKATPVDKVHTWPHLLIGEFVAALACTAFVFIFSVVAVSLKKKMANNNLTPKPS